MQVNNLLHTSSFSKSWWFCPSIQDLSLLSVTPARFLTPPLPPARRSWILIHWQISGVIHTESHARHRHVLHTPFTGCVVPGPELSAQTGNRNACVNYCWEITEQCLLQDHASMSQTWKSMEARRLGTAFCAKSIPCEIETRHSLMHCHNHPYSVMLANSLTFWVLSSWKGAGKTAQPSNCTQ